MTTRGQLEGSIADALARLSPEDMQRVAEDYARIRFPDRFPRFDFRAFGEEGKSRPGWPDAWIDLGGRFDGVEATGAKEKLKVAKHLEDDLNRARAHVPRLSGLIIVSGHPGVQFSPEDVATWRKRFVDEAEIAEERIHLVFGGGLVEELTRPEFARTRVEVLRLAAGPKHFKLALAKRGPDESRLSDFIPSDEDYALGRVHRPEVADQVLAQLDRRRCALVRGVGACGKSVLAWLLALEATELRRPAYMLDLADYIDASPDTANALVEDLHRFSHPHVLFVVDNCHLNEPLAKEVFLAWEASAKSQQPRLLLLGREVRTSRGSLIDGLRIEPTILKARQREVRGVYLRLAWRHTGDWTPPEPPPEALDSWVRAFGGDPQRPDTTTDLIAFSAAVRRQMADLLTRQWTLSEADAIEEVRSVYLDALNDGETLNLMRLCTMEELETSISEEALADCHAGFDRCCRRHGLVFRQMARTGKHVRYRLAHAALGRLILRASRRPFDMVAERLAIALQCPFDGAKTVARLAATERLPEALELVSAMLRQPVFLLDLGSLHYVQLTLRLIRRLGVPLPTDLGRTLTRPNERRKLVARTLDTPLHFVASFLNYAAKATELKRVFRALAKDLAQPSHRPALVARALETPLDCVASFLNYAAKTATLKPVFTALAEDLAQPSHHLALVARALETPLEALASFLGYAAKTAKLKPVFTALAKDLAQPSHRLALVARALETPLAGLASFLGYAAKTAELEPIFSALAEDLAQPRNCRYLATAMERQPLSAVVSVLRADVAGGLWTTVFADIDAAAWEETRRAEERPTVDAFVAFQRIATQKGRPELAEAPALRLVVGSTREDWHRPGLGIHHLSHILRFAREATPGQIACFLDTIATPTWTDGQMESTTTGGLAGSVLALATILEPDQRHWFQREALRGRVSRELSRLRMCDADARAQTLSLLGAAAAVGVSMREMRTHWPDASGLAEVLKLRLPDTDRSAIGPLQVQLWLGLREMARLRADSVTVAPTLAEPILAIWQAANRRAAEHLPLPHVRHLHDTMIVWLQQCKADGWRLVKP